MLNIFAFNTLFLNYYYYYKIKAEVKPVRIFYVEERDELAARVHVFISAPSLKNCKRWSRSLFVKNMPERKPVTRSSATDEEIIMKVIEKILNSQQFMDRMIDIICKSVNKQFNEKIKVLEDKVDVLTQEVAAFKENT